jgi:hypothetical protein
MDYGVYAFFFSLFVEISCGTLVCRLVRWIYFVYKMTAAEYGLWDLMDGV